MSTLRALFDQALAHNQAGILTRVGVFFLQFFQKRSGPDRSGRIAPADARGDYEEMVASPQTDGRKSVAAREVDWDERCLAFYRSRPAMYTACQLQVRYPFYLRSEGCWKHSRPVLSRCTWPWVSPGAAPKPSRIPTNIGMLHD